MRNLEFYDGKTNWQQVQKRTAAKLFAQGEELVFCPCNFVPFGFWSCGILVEGSEDTERDFNKAVNSFEYYNCSSETGLYTTFYKKS